LILQHLILPSLLLWLLPLHRQQPAAAAVWLLVGTLELAVGAACLGRQTQLADLLLLLPLLLFFV
jgi:hypothetical protein